MTFAVGRPTLESGCCSADDVRDAAYVCQQLGIPHYVLNYKDLFRQEVRALCGGIPARAHAEPLHQAATDILNLGPFPISSGSWALT